MSDHIIKIIHSNNPIEGSNHCMDLCIYIILVVYKPYIACGLCFVQIHVYGLARWDSQSLMQFVDIVSKWNVFNTCMPRKQFLLEIARGRVWQVTMVVRLWFYSLISGHVVRLLYKPYTVKPVFKGFSDGRTPCDQGTFSLNCFLSSCWGTCDEGIPVMKGHRSWRDTGHVGTPVIM